METSEKILIEGGKELYGDVTIGGMKNSALPILFATLLIKEECIIKNVPRVSDIYNTLEILRDLGATAYFCDTNTVAINTKNATNLIKKQSLISKMRASSYLMGAFLARFGEIQLTMPGGCNFGVRPIEQHLKGFEALGAKCTEIDGMIKISTHKKLKSNKITLDKISVGATINMVLASAFLDGLTIINNCAAEPHVDDLICFLNQCGAKIIRQGRAIYVLGVNTLHGTEYRIFPDMIEALTYMAFVGACKGEIALHSCEGSHLTYSIDIFREMGIDINLFNDTILVKRKGSIFGTNVITAPYPLFPTDLHPQFSALLCYTIDGGTVREDIFPTRFAYVKELKKMGADIVLHNNIVKIKGSCLVGERLDATDLRAGAALVVAALGANGISEINNVNYIVRGYECLTEKISSLGGKIKIIKGE